MFFLQEFLESNSVISEIKTAEQAIDENTKLKSILKEAQECLRAISQSTFEGIVILEDDKIIELNDNFAEIHGYKREELIGKNLLILIIPESSEKVKQHLLSGSDKPLEIVALKKDGSTFDAELRGKTINYKGASCHVGAIHDITERKQLQAKLENYAQNLERLVNKQTKQLKDAERLAAIGQTAGMVGHDIRNPLQAIISEIYLMKADSENMQDCIVKEAMHQSIAFIEEQIDYINKIVSDLQDYAKPIKPDWKKINVNESIEGAIAMVTVPSNVQVTVQVESSLRRLMLDPFLLKRVLVNLVTNSVQAMPNGGKLTAKAFTEANKVKITIEDTGVGIPNHVKPKIFQPLMTTKSKGQGFGLAVAERLVEVQDGSISFESEENVGTKFTLEFPLGSNAKNRNLLDFIK